MSRASCLSRGTTQTLGLGDSFPEVSQATVAQRRLAKIIVLIVAAGALGRFRLHLADCFLKRQPLSRNVGFVQCRMDTAQLRNQRGTRAIV